MSLLETIKKDLSQSLKSGEKEKTGALRFLLSEIHNAEIEKQGELTDEEILAVIRRLVKQRKESIEGFEKGGRDDLVAKEERELELLNKFLPQQMSDEELEKVIDQAIADVGAKTSADIGRVMSVVMKAVSGRAEGAKVAEMVRQKLSS